ncbi:hypothetical protein [Shimia sp. FJ5]|uniref:hypothetical protein n=1 Tax=Shimia sp. FJ5 TaxID=3079054 RepID=UPI00293DBE95|nr:hypothetical protein [Shimia sp. FJ5]MDV4146475.1 hypothetical protein [Shimia sp. FJ5]
MANDKKTFQDRLAEEIDEAITNASVEDVRKEAEEAGEDIATFGDRMRAWLETAKDEVAKMAMKEAKAAAEKDRAAHNQNVVSMSQRRLGSRPDSFMPDTVAARHGKKLSERDRKGIEKDLEDLFDDDAWPDKKGDDE